MSEGDEAGNLLALAWHQLFGRNPNSAVAYSTTVKALEAATKNSIAPKDEKYTLGKGLSNMRNQQWHYAIEADLGETAESPRNVDGGVIQLMMRSIWEAQHDRHGAVEGTNSISPEEARAAIFLAVPVIQAFHDKLVVRPTS
ncbi:hypothetical protein DDE84_02555 [Bifidobacterium tibiigranuli]|uniref:Uncharacterized protein n=2 Tax=Bifidobacterium tibiigranuli TaxID=2172043 RepID=A0A5N6RZM4_9BIFI|nr:hypothetical protein DDF78_08775 [Bifidobacterium tibiigranuli]KAE8129698.1 hypothetical protein DDE84_02555 [Bifidobacterium tibiigranuli]